MLFRVFVVCEIKMSVCYDVRESRCEVEERTALVVLVYYLACPPFCSRVDEWVPVFGCLSYGDRSEWYFE